MTYNDYLTHHKYSFSTIKIHNHRIERFKKWTKNNNTTLKIISYKQLLHYVKYLQEEKKYKRTSINNELRAVKLYFDYQITENIRQDNPAENLTIRGKRTKVLSNLLTEEELEDLYYTFETNHYDTFFQATKKRDKIVLGLILYQGITAIELYQLQEEHLQLEKGRINIPTTRRSNRRTLKLQPLQMMDLSEYITNIREYLGKRIQTSNDEQLIHGSIDQIRTITGRIIKNLKKQNHVVKNYSQLRSSVIVNWLSKNNLRQVQYMAGHRYISSTEKYVQDDLENLHEIINNYHPIN